MLRVGHEQVADRINGDPVREEQACLGGRHALRYCRPNGIYRVCGALDLVDSERKRFEISSL